MAEASCHPLGQWAQRWVVSAPPPAPSPRPQRCGACAAWGRHLVVRGGRSSSVPAATPCSHGLGVRAARHHGPAAPASSAAPFDPPPLLDRAPLGAWSLGASTDGTDRGPGNLASPVGPPAPVVRAAPAVTRFVWSVPPRGGFPVAGHVAESWVSIPLPPPCPRCRRCPSRNRRLPVSGTALLPVRCCGGAVRLWSGGLKVGATMASPGKRREMDLMKLYVAPELQTASGPRW